MPSFTDYLNSQIAAGQPQQQGLLDRIYTGLLGAPNTYGGLLTPSAAQEARRRAISAISADLLASGGVTRQPISIGQALGSAIQAGQAAQDQSTARSLQNELLLRQLQKPSQPLVTAPVGSRIYDPNTGKVLLEGEPQQTDDQREYAAAQAAGYKGTFTEFKRDQQQPQGVGTLYQVVDPQTGKPVFTTGPNALGRTPYEKPALGPKDINTAKQKLIAIDVARKQLDLAKKNFGALKGGITTGPFGQGMIPSEGGKLYDSSIDSLRQSITGLTRTPGIGSMSDFETRLNQAQLPSRSEYESSQEQKLQSITDMLDTLETGYKQMLGDQESSPSSPSSPTTGGEITATGPNGQKIVLRNGQWVPLGR